MILTKVLSTAALGAILTVNSLTAHAATTQNCDTQVKVEAKQEQASITKEFAQQIALKECNGFVKSTKLSKENGVYIYNVTILGEDGKAHNLKVNCDSKKVVQHVTMKKQVTITKEDAQQVALNECKGAVKSAELKNENGIYIFNVTILGEDGKEHDLKVNCDSKKVIQLDTVDKQIAITKEKAQSVALSQCEGTVKSYELTKEKEVYVYIIKIVDKENKEQTVKIDAESGKVCDCN